MGEKDFQVIVLKGGISSEREISLQTGNAVSEALRSLDYQVNELDVTQKDFELPLEVKSGGAVFICLHGTFGEDGELQKRLEDKGVKFTGAGSRASGFAFDKLKAKEKFLEERIETPRGEKWEKGIEKNWKYPFVLKPVSDGSSVGVYLIRSLDDFEKAVEAIENSELSSVSYMIEELIEGREFTVGIIDEQALPVIEIVPNEGFYDYEHKYTAGLTRHVCPADISAELTSRLQQMAIAAHMALGIEVYSRVDFMVSDEKEEVFVIEVNTVPGMTKLSLLPEAAEAAGIGFSELCEKILNLSLELRS